LRYDGGLSQGAGDPARANDGDVKDYLEFMKKWNPQDSPYDFYATVAYVNAAMLRTCSRNAATI